MKHTYLLISKMLLGNFVKFVEKYLFSQDVVIYTADNRNVHCVNEVHSVFCIIQSLFYFVLDFLLDIWMHINSFKYFQSF
jgi:hypothetical protein